MLLTSTRSIIVVPAGGLAPKDVEARTRKLQACQREKLLFQFRIASVFLTAILVLDGCATPYQPRGATGGYVDQKIDDNTYVVSFYGNGKTSRDQVFRMWLYRCADLTSQAGYDYFVVLLKPRHTSYKDPLEGTPPEGGAGADDVMPTRSGGGAPTYYYAPGGSYSVTTWSARAPIRMYKGEPPKGQALTFRVREILADLGPEVIDGQSSGSVTGKYSPDIVFGSGALSMNTSATSDRGAVPSAPEMDDLKDLLPGGQR